MTLSKEHATAEVRAPGRGGWARFFALELLDNRYPSLHGLRVLAIISVLQLHVTVIYGAFSDIQIDSAWAEKSRRIFFGMDLFFILSGFLIGAILLRAVDVARTQNVGRFYIRRIFRTFPSYYVVLTALACAKTLTPSQHHNLIYEYLYLTNFVSLTPYDVVMVWGWSLALEEQFYLTVPLFVFALCRLKSDRARAILLVAAWLSGLVIRLWYYFAHQPFSGEELADQVYFRTQTRFDPLVAGIFIAFVEMRWRDPLERWLSHPAHRALVALPTLACLWLLIEPTITGEQNQAVTKMFLWGTVTSLFYAGTLLLLFHGHGWLPRFLSRPVFRRVATLGYGVYLVHVPVMSRILLPLTQHLHVHRLPTVLVWPLLVVALLVLSLLVAYVMHIVIEKPSLWLRDRLTT